MTFPPVHPILVNFTAALVPVSLFSDVLGRVMRKPSLNVTGWWTLLFAILITPLTAVAGWYWLWQMTESDQSTMAIHKWLGTALAVLLPLLVWFRWRSYRRGISPGWVYIACAAIVLVVLTVQGHLGGVMSFGQDAPSDTADIPTKSPVK